MYNHILYLGYWLTNTVVLFVSSLLFRDLLVLGNTRYTPLEAAIYSGFWATFVIWVIWDFLLARGVKYGKTTKTFFSFWGINIISFGCVSLFYGTLGTQIKDTLLILWIALVANLIQRLVWGNVTGQKTD